MTKSFNMVKPVLVFLLFAGILLSGACKKVNYHQLTDEDMAWLVYKNNQIDRFSNSNGDIVSFKVGLRTKTYDDGGDKANEFTIAYFTQLNDTSAYQTSDSKGLLYIYKQDDDALLVTFSWPHFPLMDVPLTNILPITATIGGVIYTDILLLDATGFTSARFYNRKLWYSKSEGVVQYENTAGEVWVRN